MIKVLEQAQYSLKSMKNYFAHTTAVIDEGAQVGTGTKIWHFAHIFGDTVIGGCIFGQNTMVAAGVRIGKNVKVKQRLYLHRDNYRR